MSDERGLRPTSLSVDELARLLTAAAPDGPPVLPEAVREDIAAGAPVGEDGRVNLVHYAAWLARELRSHGG